MGRTPSLIVLLLLGAPGAIGAERVTPCPDCPPMAVIPPGVLPATSGPGKEVRFTKPFALGSTEVTFDQWRACVDDGACPGGQDDHGWGRGKRPVINVTWAEAQTYAAWVGRRSGLVCRLPDEAEWEYAARAGTLSAYWWGEAMRTDMANCRDCTSEPEPPYGSKPVASYDANPWGLHDMNGNVWEWTASCWPAARKSPAAADGDGCPDKVIKGGSWYYYSPMARSAARAKNGSRVSSYNIGFRILCEYP